MKRTNKLEMEWLNLKTLEKDLVNQSEFLVEETKRQMLKNIYIARLLIDQKTSIDIRLLEVQKETLLIQGKLQTISLEKLKKELDENLEELNENLKSYYKCSKLLQEQCGGIKNEVWDVNESGNSKLKAYYSWLQERTQTEIDILKKKISTLGCVESMGTWPLNIRTVSTNKKH